MTVYMIMTRDKYRLPRWWGTTTAELARLSGRKYQNVRFAIRKAFRNGGGAFDTDGLWKPTKDGLGYARVLDYIGVRY